MKIIDRIALSIFSVIILLLSLSTLVMIFGWIDIPLIVGGLEFIIQNSTISNIVLGINIVFVLLSIKCIFFDSYSSEKDGIRDGIMLQNETGKLLISKETLENLANSVVKSFDSAENITTKVILDKENNVKIDVVLHVHPDSIIKDLSLNLQNKIKEAIKKSLDLEVKEVNIKIKNIATKKVAVQE